MLPSSRGYVATLVVGEDSAIADLVLYNALRVGRRKLVLSKPKVGASCVVGMRRHVKVMRPATSSQGGRGWLGWRGQTPSKTGWHTEGNGARGH